MFRTNAPNEHFHATVVSANTQHDHFGLYITPSDTRARALTNAVDHVLRQAQRTGARMRADARALVATGGGLGPAAYISSRIDARVTATCGAQFHAADELREAMGVVHAASPDAVFAHDDDVFDIVLSVDALSAGHDKRAMLADAFRILREGGILAVMDVVARPSARRAHLIPFEKAMAVPPLMTLYAYEKLLQELGFVLMRTCDLSAHVVKSYKQVIASARESRETIRGCAPEVVDAAVKQLDDDVRRMKEDDTIGWTSFVALKRFEDERDGKLVVE